VAGVFLFSKAIAALYKIGTRLSIICPLSLSHKINFARVSLKLSASFCSQYLLNSPARTGRVGRSWRNIKVKVHWLLICGSGYFGVSYIKAEV
jgi:hypothetical protein